MVSLNNIRRTYKQAWNKAQWTVSGCWNIVSNIL